MRRGLRRRDWIAAAGPWLGAALAPAVLGACTDTSPWRLGFLGPLSGSAADLGEAGRNGLLLAVDAVNAGGGVAGRRVDLRIEDDAQSPDQARRGFAVLRDAKVDAVIGPFTSGIATVVLPMAESARVLLVSPTVTAMDFAERDDQLIRLNRTTRLNAQETAQRMARAGLRRIAIGQDLRNRTYSESWVREFSQACAALGGEVLVVRGFETGSGSGVGEVAANLLAPRPDALLLVANAVDVARLAQRVRQSGSDVPMWSSEWAASESLLMLGGKALEGMVLLQSHDRDSQSPAWLRFREAYLRRFQGEPSYASVLAHDAASVVFAAMAGLARGADLRAAILALGPVPGLQQEVSLDRWGDARPRAVFTEVRGGRFATLP